MATTTRPRILSSGMAAPWTPAWPPVLPHLLQARSWPHKRAAASARRQQDEGRPDPLFPD